MAFNENLAIKWLDALREPGRKQAREALIKKTLSGELEGQCCLGVLCEVAGMVEVATSIDTSYNLYKNAYQNKTEKMRGEIYITSPPQSLSRQLGLSESDIEYLMKLNDVERRSFKYIANWLEKKWKKEKLV